MHDIHLELFAVVVLAQFFWISGRKKRDGCACGLARRGPWPSCFIEVYFDCLVDIAIQDR